MQVSINNIDVDYLELGKSKSDETIIFLHGWHNTANKEKYLELLKLLSNQYHLIALDFPGFGQSSEPVQPWTVSDYATLVENFIDKLNLKKIILIGHSFGGRVAIKIAAKNKSDIKKIILVASAGVEKKSLSIKLLNATAGLTPQFIKKIFSQHLGSADYKKTSGIMRQTFKNIINEDLQDFFPKIKVPVLLVWGDLDHTTPLDHAKTMKRLIPNSTLKIIKNGNHGIPYRHAPDVAEIILNYLS